MSESDPQEVASRRATRPQRLYWPVVLDVTERAILIVGGGLVGYQKVKSLAALGLRATVISRDFDPRIAAFGFNLLLKSFEITDLEGFDLILVCTDDPALNDAVTAAAQGLGLLVNNASHPEAGDFIAPATIKKGPYFVSVSSSGTGVKAAVALRDVLRAPFEDFVQKQS